MSPAPRPEGLELECDAGGCKTRATVILARNGRAYCRPHGLADALRLVNGRRSNIEPIGELAAWLIFGRETSAPAPSMLHRRRAGEPRTVCGLEPPAPSLLYQEAEEASKRCRRCFAPNPGATAASGPANGPSASANA
jgi:hypothetical protein